MHPNIPTLSLLASLFLAFSMPLSAQEAPVALPMGEDTIIVVPGGIPDYDALRLKGDSTDLSDVFLATLPTFADDVVTSNIVFPEVEVGSTYYALDLVAVVELALEGNFALENSRRGIQIARSSTRSAEATFIPYVDLVGSSTFRKNTNIDATRTVAAVEYEFVPRVDPVTGVTTYERIEIPTTRQIPTKAQDSTWRSEGGVESGVTLPTGGRLTLNGTESVTNTRFSDGGSILETDRHDADAEIGRAHV